MEGSREPTKSEPIGAEKARIERVRFVFLQAPLPILFSPLAAALMAIALWEVGNRSHLVIWVGGAMMLAAGRLLLIRSYPRKTNDPALVRTFEKLFVASIAVVALWWGVGGTLMLGELLAQRILVFSFLVLMAGATISSYAAHPLTVHLSVLALAGPIVVLFASEADAFHGAIAIAGVLYLWATLKSVRTTSYFFGQTQLLAHELRQAHRDAQRLARTDHLTRLWNRRAFYELGVSSTRQAHERKRPLALMLIDVDHFESIKNRFGHVAGDATLRCLASALKEQFEEIAFIGRLGGDDFGVLLPSTSVAEANDAGESFRGAVELLNPLGQAVRLTVSVGVAPYDDGQTFEQLVETADAALYRAKRGGRNCVVAAVSVSGWPSTSPAGVVASTS